MIPNSPDDNHCFQSCIQMLFEFYFYPINGSAIEDATGYQKGKWTWPFEGFRFLVKSGLTIHYIDYFDVDQFTRNPDRWVEDIFGSSADNIRQRSNLYGAASAAKEIMKIDGFVHSNRTPNMSDLSDALSDDRSVLVGVNSAILNNRNGYTGHFVLLNLIEGDLVYVTDPGLPAYENRAVDRALFVRAWQSPSEQNAWAAIISRPSHP